MADADGYRIPEVVWQEIKHFVRDNITGQITLHFIDGDIRSWDKFVKQRIINGVTVSTSRSQIQLKSA